MESSLSGTGELQSPLLNEKPAVGVKELKAGAAGGPSVPLLHATGGMGVLSTSSPQSDMLNEVESFESFLDVMCLGDWYVWEYWESAYQVEQVCTYWLCIC